MKRILLAAFLCLGAGYALAESTVTVTPGFGVASPAPQQAQQIVTAPTGAIAAVPKPDGTLVFVYPIIHDLEPYIVLALGTLITGLGSAALAAFYQFLQSRFRISVDQNTQNKIKANLDLLSNAAKTEAGVWIAAQEPGWRDLAIDVKNPAVAKAAQVVVDHYPDEAANIGLTPERMAKWIIGEIGKAQVAVGTPAVTTPPRPQVPVT